MLSKYIYMIMCKYMDCTLLLLKQMSISKRVVKQRLQILLHRNEQNHKLKQLMTDLLLSE